MAQSHKVLALRYRVRGLTAPAAVSTLCPSMPRQAVSAYAEAMPVGVPGCTGIELLLILPL